MTQNAAIVRIPLPDRLTATGTATREGVHAWVRETMADEAGGWTEYQATGGWVDGDGDTVREPITVYETVLTGAQARPKKARGFAYTLARELLFLCEEDEIMWLACTREGIDAGFEERR